MKNVFKLFGTQSRWFCAIALAAVIGFGVTACGGGSRTVTYRGAAEDGSTYTLIITEAAHSEARAEAQVGAALSVTGPYLATPKTLGKNALMAASDTGSADPFAPSAGDSYVLTVGKKKSTGEVEAVTGSTLTLKPKASEAAAFDAAISDNGLTNVKGLITFDDGSEEEGPGPLTPISLDDKADGKNKTDDSSFGDAKLSEKILKTFKGNQYHMVTKTKVSGMEIISDTYFKDGMVAVTTKNMGMNVTSITKNNKVYSIMHDLQTYMVIDMPEKEKSTSDSMYYDGQKFTGSGRAMFDGKERAYEEFTYDGKGSKIVIRYFFDGNEFVGVSAKADKSPIMEMVVMSFSTSVPSNAFDIPKGYTEMPGMQDIMKMFN